MCKLDVVAQLNKQSSQSFPERQVPSLFVTVALQYLPYILETVVYDLFPTVWYDLQIHLCSLFLRLSKMPAHYIV